MPKDEIETDTAGSMKFTIKDGTEVSIEDIKRLYEINQEQQAEIKRLCDLLEKAVTVYEKKSRKN